MCEREKTHEDAEVADPIQFTKEEQAREVIESLENYLSLKYGTAKVPLSYVTRPSVEAPTGDDDPGFGNYPSMIDEAIQRSRHEGEDFADDNKMVWEVLRKSCHGGAGWAWIKKYKNSKDGCQALIDLKDHYMGRDHQSKIKAQAADIIKSAYYDRKARNFSFSKFASRLNSAFEDLENPGSEEHGEPKTETEKKHILFEAINDPKLEAPIAVLKAQPDQYRTFQSAADFLSNFLADTSKSTGGRRNLSEIGRGGRGRGRGGRGGRGRGGRGGHGGRGKGGKTSPYDPENPTKTYTSKEWRSMSESEQAKVRKAREEDRLSDKRKLAELTQKLEGQATGTATGTGTANIQAVGTQMTSKKVRIQE